MSHIEQFLKYAAAFEVAYVSDDWSVITPFFTEDAVYETLADPPLASRFDGREAVVASFKRVLDSFDRRFDSRRVEMLEGPVERDNSVWMRWAATYARQGAPDLRIEGEETAFFDGDRICRLEDRWPPAAVAQMVAYLTEYAGTLKTQS